MGRYQDSLWPPVLLLFQLQWSRWSALFGGMDPPHWIAQCPEYLLPGNPKSTALVMVVSISHTYHMHWHCCWSWCCSSWSTTSASLLQLEQLSPCPGRGSSWLHTLLQLLWATLPNLLTVPPSSGALYPNPWQRSKAREWCSSEEYVGLNVRHLGSIYGWLSQSNMGAGEKRASPQHTSRLKWFTRTQLLFVI